MGFIPKEERRRIFRNELYTLKELGYLSADDYQDVTEAHDDYYLALLAREQEELAEQQNRLNTDVQTKPEKRDDADVKKVGKAASMKPQKSAEEIRERNISWSLNLGVIMLLIGGLFVATSNWDSMTPGMKAGAIAFVAFLFYGLAYASYVMLKINKTAFAFVVLGSLFLPIFTLSLGWFELLGSYFSFKGEGRFFLGAASSILLIPIYGLLAKLLSSRLFVWFTYIASSAAAAFILRMFSLENDGFYLGLMIFNSLLVVGYHYGRKKNALPLFTNELAIYSQANLVISTLLLLLFFDNPVFYGFNLILTAIIYLSMIFIGGRREYHFVFTAMLVYGAYQILESDVLGDGNVIGYSLIGFVFLLLATKLNDQFALKKTFQWTSAAVSGMAFVYVSAEGMLLRSEDPSIFLLIAYLLISVNFLFLANSQRNILFRYLSPVFLATALYEAVGILGSWNIYSSTLIPYFLIGFGLFTFMSLRKKLKFVHAIEESTRDVGVAIMLSVSLIAFVSFRWWELSLMSLLASGQFFVMMKIEKRAFLRRIARWAVPVSLGISIVSLGRELGELSTIYHEHAGIAGNFAAAGILLAACSYYLRAVKKVELSNSTFFISHGFYAAALFTTFLIPVNTALVESMIWLIGILMSILLYKTKKDPVLRFIPGVIFLSWYLLTMDSLSDHLYVLNDAAKSLLLPGAAWTLLAFALLCLKRDRILAGGMAWVAHIYLAPVLILALVSYGELAMWPYMVSTLIYAVCISFVVDEGKKRAFLYAAFTAGFLTIKTGIILTTGSDFGYFAFFASSLLLAGFWSISPKQLQKWTPYYLVPFSLLGLVSFLSTYPFTWLLYGFTIVYASAFIGFLHKIKWDLYVILPLLMTFIATIQIILLTSVDVYYELAHLSGFGIFLLFAGKMLYPKFAKKGGALGLQQLDGYTIIAFAYVIAILIFQSETFWAQIIHGLFFSGGLWLQRNRVEGATKKMLAFLAGAYLLIPYYAAIGQLDIPDLLQMEVYVLPFIPLAIFLRYLSKERWHVMAGYIEWGILILISLILIQDGLSSNTIYDAILLGSLSLTAMISGMWFKIKSYFFVGIGVLLLNIFMQTKQFWGNLPWWGYLLAAGTILISIASFNEWKKQKNAKDVETFILKFIKKISEKLKYWN